jgi:glycosyltransferase involved in cell wall biosynthesis
MFSIVIPTLNEEKLLPLLLESLVTQTNRDFEVIVVDGSSTDKTVEITRSYTSKLPKLRVVVSKKASLPLQRNLGAAEGTGEWLVFVDADSILFPHFVERIQSFIKDSHPQVFTAWCRPDSEEPKDANIALLYNIVLEMSIILHRPFSPGPLTIVSRDVFRKLGGYDETRGYNEDVDFSIRAHKKNFQFRVLHETLYVWSLRRLRRQGTIRVAQQYMVSALPVLFLNRSFKYMPGYTMGGQLYKRGKQLINRATLKQYEKKLKKVLREFIE